MANRLHAGDKAHLGKYRVKRVDGKLKAVKVKIAVGDQKLHDTYAICGIDHHGEDLQWFLKIRKDFPSKVCKKCDKKLKAMIEAA